MLSLYNSKYQDHICIISDVILVSHLYYSHGLYYHNPSTPVCAFAISLMITRAQLGDLGLTKLQKMVPIVHNTRLWHALTNPSHILLLTLLSMSLIAYLFILYFLIDPIQ